MNKSGIYVMCEFIAIILLMVVMVTTASSARAADGTQDGWVLNADSRDSYNPPTLGTGRIGMTLSDNPFRISHIVMNNIYDKGDPLGVSQIVCGIVFANLQLVVDGKKIEESDMSDWKQQLDMKKACLTTWFSYDDKVKVQVTTYALRNIPYAGLMDVQISALQGVEYSVSNRMDVPGDLVGSANSYNVKRDNSTIMALYQTRAKTAVYGYSVAATSVFLFPNDQKVHAWSEENQLVGSGFEGKLDAGQTLKFSLAGAVCAQPDFVDPKSESERFCIAILLQGKETVLVNHTKAWDKLWQHDIEVEGDLQSQRDIRFALFNLYSYSLAGSRLSIPPMGLSARGYNGHLFWDMELWMYPPMLLLQPDFAKTFIDYRFDRLAKAKQKAANFGYAGAMFPWESDNTGEEATPTWALTVTIEHHITADVGIAAWNYYLITHDKAWLKSTGFPLIREAADFWVSRVDADEQGIYHIRHVVGADEYAQNVDDNAFTNGSAITLLRIADRAAKELRAKTDPSWRDTADRIVIPTFDDGVTKDHAAYNGETIKQADANLLAYPLKIVTEESKVRTDLDYYEQKIDKGGPAMGYSILAVLHARLGDRQRAWELWQRSYIPHRRPPFGTLSEGAGGNNPYFCTGAGGMLQAVLFGFAGLDISEHGLTRLNPCLPEGWKSLTIKGVGVKSETIRIDASPSQPAHKTK